MTYKQLIDELKTLLEDHRLVNQWGYGNLSDIETPETGAPNYPYVFINPSQVTIEEYGFDVNLNLIAMDQPLINVDAEIDATSRCLGLIQDILAKFRNTTTYQEADVELAVLCTPFKERFKDSVIGVAANITFQIKEPLDVCDTPIIATDDVVRAWDLATITYDPDIVGGELLTFREKNLDPLNLWNVNRIEIGEDDLGDYRVELDFDMKLVEPVGGEIIPQGLNIYELQTAQVFQPRFTTGWPTAFESPTTVYTVHVEFEITATTPSVWEFIRINNTPSPESAMTVIAGSEEAPQLKVYKYR